MKNKYLFTYILLGVLTFLFYGNTFKNEYTLDDAIVITKNQFTKSGLKGIKDILTHDTFTGFFGVEKKLLEGGRYRPLSLITFAIEYELFGLNPHISHLINILLYLFLCVIIYYFFNLLFKEENQENKFINLSFLATLLFLAHPIHTEVVANIKGRDEILSLIGSVGAAISVFRYLKNEKKKHLFYSFLWFIVGIFSKENTITFLAVIPLSIFFFTNTTPKKFIISIVPAALATALFLIIRKIILGNTDNVVTELMNNPFLNATVNQKYATIMYTWGLYLKLLVFPHPLTFDYYPYHIALTTWNNKWVIVSALVILIILILALINTKKRPIPSFAILFFFITFSIVSNVLFPVGTFMNERFMFVPSIGFCLLIAYFFIKAIHIKPKSNIHKFSTLFIITVILSLFFIKTYTRNKAWKDDFTLFSTDVKTSANSAKSNTSYGGNLLEKSAMEEDSLKKMEMQRTAIFHLRKAVEIHPKYVDALILLGNAYAGYKNMNDSAMFFYKTALKRTPNNDLAFNNIHIILNRVDDIDYRIKEYNEIYNINPNRSDICYKLGHLYGRYRNDLPKSIKYLERAVYFNSNDFTSNKDLGVAYGISGNYEKSEYYFIKALKINPNDIETYKNLYITYSFMKDDKKAQQILEIIKKFEIQQNQPN